MSHVVFFQIFGRLQSGSNRRLKNENREIQNAPFVMLSTQVIVALENELFENFDGFTRIRMGNFR